MAIKRVRVGQEYTFSPVMFDALMPTGQIKSGTRVKVVNLTGCPKANTMGHCYIVPVDRPKSFAQLVHCNSLQR